MSVQNAETPADDPGGEAGVEAGVEAEIVDRLDDADLRFTSGRQAIVRALRSADGPVSLPKLLALAPSLAQSSAYRNLAVLEEVGVVRRVAHGDGHARYELAEPLTEHHHHLICASCGTVVDVSFDESFERSLDDGFSAAAQAAGFTLGQHEIDLFGTCGDCAS